jgi:hypothetical protein
MHCEAINLGNRFLESFSKYCQEKEVSKLFHHFGSDSLAQEKNT